MPFVQRQIQPVFVCNGRLPASVVDNEREAVANAALVGALRQLASLMRHTEQLYDQLVEQQQAVHVRVDRLRMRVANVQQRSAQLDSRTVPVPESDLSTFCRLRHRAILSAASDTHTGDDDDGMPRLNLFTTANRPATVAQLYQQAVLNPVHVLRSLDTFRRDGQRSSRFFTCTPTLESQTSRISLDIESRMPAEVQELPAWTGATDSHRLMYPVHPDVRYTKLLCSPSEQALVCRLPSPGQLAAARRRLARAETVTVDTSGARFQRLINFRRSLIQLDYVKQRKKRRTRQRRSSCGESSPNDTSDNVCQSASSRDTPSTSVDAGSGGTPSSNSQYRPDSACRIGGGVTTGGGCSDSGVGSGCSNRASTDLDAGAAAARHPSSSSSSATIVGSGRHQQRRDQPRLNQSSCAEEPYDDTDDASSAFSCDAEGYYTSFHCDSGVRTVAAGSGSTAAVDGAVSGSSGSVVLRRRQRSAVQHHRPSRGPTPPIRASSLSSTHIAGNSGAVCATEATTAGGGSELADRSSVVTVVHVTDCASYAPPSADTSSTRDAGSSLAIDGRDDDGGSTTNSPLPNGHSTAVIRVPALCVVTSSDDGGAESDSTLDGGSNRPVAETEVDDEPSGPQRATEQPALNISHERAYLTITSGSQTTPRPAPAPPRPHTTCSLDRRHWGDRSRSHGTNQSSSLSSSSTPSKSSHCQNLQPPTLPSDVSRDTLGNNSTGDCNGVLTDQTPHNSVEQNCEDSTAEVTTSPTETHDTDTDSRQAVKSVEVVLPCHLPSPPASPPQMRLLAHTPAGNVRSSKNREHETTNASDTAGQAIGYSWMPVSTAVTGSTSQGIHVTSERSKIRCRTASPTMISMTRPNTSIVHTSLPWSHQRTTHVNGVTSKSPTYLMRSLSIDNRCEKSKPSPNESCRFSPLQFLQNRFSHRQHTKKLHSNGEAKHAAAIARSPFSLGRSSLRLPRISFKATSSPLNNSGSDNEEPHTDEQKLKRLKKKWFWSLPRSVSAGGRLGSVPKKDSTSNDADDDSDDGGFKCRPSVRRSLYGPSASASSSDASGASTPVTDVSLSSSFYEMEQYFPSLNASSSAATPRSTGAVHGHNDSSTSLGSTSGFCVEAPRAPNFSCAFAEYSPPQLLHSGSDTDINTLTERYSLVPNGGASGQSMTTRDASAGTHSVAPAGNPKDVSDPALNSPPADILSMWRSPVSSTTNTQCQLASSCRRTPHTAAVSIASTGCVEATVGYRRPHTASSPTFAFQRSFSWAGQRSAPITNGTSSMCRPTPLNQFRELVARQSAAHPRPALSASERLRSLLTSPVLSPLDRAYSGSAAVGARSRASLLPTRLGGGGSGPRRCRPTRTDVMSTTIPESDEQDADAAADEDHEISGSASAQYDRRLPHRRDMAPALLSPLYSPRYRALRHQSAWLHSRRMRAGLTTSPPNGTTAECETPPSSGRLSPVSECIAAPSDGCSTSQSLAIVPRGPLASSFAGSACDFSRLRQLYASTALTPLRENSIDVRCDASSTGCDVENDVEVASSLCSLETTL